MHRLVAPATALLGSSLSFTSASTACCTFRATVSPLQLVLEVGFFGCALTKTHTTGGEQLPGV